MLIYVCNHVNAQNNSALQNISKQKLEVLLKAHKNIRFVMAADGSYKFYEVQAENKTITKTTIVKGNTSAASNFHITKDINVQTDANPANTSYESANTDAPYAILNNVMYFAANDGTHGNELWRSDGTALGTYMVADIEPGFQGSNPSEIVASANKIIFVCGNAAINHYALWASDGTAAGTTLIKDNIQVGNGVNNQHYLTNVSGSVYFFVSYLPQLWKTNGTAESTVLVKDFSASAQAPFLPITLNGLFYFTIYTNANGRELWRSDGTDAGTFMVKDISSSTDFFNGPYQLTPFNNKLYFTADEGNGTGRKLWFTDGTTAGTMPANGQNNVQLSDYFLLSLFNTPFIVKNNSFFTNASTPSTGMELFKYNTSDGFKLVKDIIPGSKGGQFFSSVKAGNMVAFTYYDSVRQQNDIWGTLGSTATTRLIKSNISQGLISSELITGNDNLIYFFTSTGDNGTELWRTNGLPGSTLMVKDIYEGQASSNPACFTLLNGKIYFRAASKNKGTELWQTNGTKAATTMVTEINKTATNYSAPNYTSFSKNYVYNILSGVALNNTVYFSATTPETGYELYKSDGTRAGTKLAADIVPGESSSSPQSFLNKNHAVYFISFNNSSINKIDSAGNTKKIISTPGAVFSYDVCDNGTIFYIINNYLTGKIELWLATDAGDAILLTDKIPTSYTPVAVKVIGTKAYFTATDEHGTELWVSDGTVAGTKMIKDINAGNASSDPYSLYVYKNNIYFGANDGSGITFWKSNGTKAGTVKVKNVVPYGGNVFAADYMDFYCIVNDVLYFNASTDKYGEELWKTDGTSAGTVLVKNISYGSGGSEPGFLTNVNGELFFTQYNFALWKSDGTPGGTVLVKNIDASPDSYLFTERCVADNKLFFNTKNLLWVSDGTDAGTHLVADNGLNGVSNIKNLVAAGDKIFFNGTSDASNAELYVGDARQAIANPVVENNPAKAAKEISFSATVLQNPVISQLKLQLQTKSNQKLNIVISNQRGYVVTQKSFQAIKGNNRCSIDAGNWQTGVYLIKISNEKGEFVDLKALK